MTYSIVALDRASGELGVAVQTRWFGVGAICPWVLSRALARWPRSRCRAGVRAARPGAPARGSLARGCPGSVAGRGPGSEVRQVGVVDAAGANGNAYRLALRRRGPPRGRDGVCWSRPAAPATPCPRPCWRPTNARPATCRTGCSPRSGQPGGRRHPRPPARGAAGRARPGLGHRRTRRAGAQVGGDGAVAPAHGAGPARRRCGGAAGARAAAPVRPRPGGARPGRCPGGGRRRRGRARCLPGRRQARPRGRPDRVDGRAQASPRARSRRACRSSAARPRPCRPGPSTRGGPLQPAT